MTHIELEFSISNLNLPILVLRVHIVMLISVTSIITHSIYILSDRLTSYSLSSFQSPIRPLHLPL